MQTPEWNRELQRWLSDHELGALSTPNIAALMLLAAALGVGLIAQTLTRSFIRSRMAGWVQKSRTRIDDVIYEKRVFSRVSRLMPGFAVYLTAPLALGTDSSDLVQRVALGYVVIVCTLAVHSMLAAVEEYYRTLPNVAAPIKSYTQMAALLLTLFSAILVVAIALNKSPLYFLSGIGAMTAVLLLVFKDALLGMVASIQLATNDMVRVGDWIEVPKFSADGEVTDITLTTVKVRNWDKTLSMLPTYALVSEAYRNWRGMQDSGGRRIKRSLPLDMNSVRHVTPELLQRLRKVQILAGYIDLKTREIEDYNREHAAEVEQSPLNGRRLTNLGLFRAYVEAYLRSRSVLREDFTFLVRQLDPGPQGLPIEVYVFTATTEWAKYEAIQADIFDHLFAAVSAFDLRLQQGAGGGDVRLLAAALERAGTSVTPRPEA